MKTVTLDVRPPSEAMADFANAWKSGKGSKSAHAGFRPAHVRISPETLECAAVISILQAGEELPRWQASRVRELDIDTRDGLAAFAEAGGKTGVPLLIINGQGVAGFSTAAYDALLRTRNERR